MELAKYKAVLYYERNQLGRDFVVGDIHGCFSKLQAALDEVGFDYEKDRLFVVGDLVDRGPESLEVLTWLEKPWFHSVRGNHEQMVVERDTCRGDWHRSNGGKWFRDLQRGVQNPYVEVLDKLPWAIEIDTQFGKVGIIHGNMPEDNWEHLKISLEGAPTQHYTDMIIWERTRIELSDDTPVEGVHMIYLGHTPLKTGPVTLGNCTFIDTGIFLGGKVTLIQIN